MGKNKNSNKKKRYLLGVLFIIIILFLIIFIFQYRHYYKVDNIIFTFWKTKNGCYIMPYKYFGMTIPKNNYMIASNIGGIIIYIGKDSTLHIFPTYTYERGASTIEINLTSYKFEYYPYINEIDDKITANNKMKIYKSNGYPFIDINIRGMSAYIGNINSGNKTQY